MVIGPLQLKSRPQPGSVMSSAGTADLPDSPARPMPDVDVQLTLWIDTPGGLKALMAGGVCV